MTTQDNLTPEAVALYRVDGKLYAPHEVEIAYRTMTPEPVEFDPPRPREIPLGLPVKTYSGVDWSTGGTYDSNRGYQTTDLSVAELATSELQFQPNGASEVWHTPLLDIDVPAALVPSTTPGHSHLYIDKPMTWQTYAQLLHALCDAGIIEVGYLHASLERQHTALRTPWTRKPADV